MTNYSKIFNKNNKFLYEIKSIFIKINLYQIKKFFKRRLEFN